MDRRQSEIDSPVAVSGHVSPSTRYADPVKRLLLVAGLALLIFGSVLVFLAFDRTSHSASDTLRPFLITMLPVWIVFAACVRILLR